ncbi:MAG: lysyl oxidase family protein [Planctomycetaceae bacterium]
MSSAQHIGAQLTAIPQLWTDPGLSVGWADVYDRGLEGQSIDITNVPDGNYWLETVVDPDNRLMESNENNNVTRIQITLRRTGGGGAIPADVFESNNSFASASILAPPEDHVYSNLSIHSSTDTDYYRVTASAPGTMAFRLTFQNAQGDVDMEVFDSNQTRIGRANSTQDGEHFSFAAIAGQYYFVRVYGYNGATNPSYSLVVDQPEGTTGGAADQFEENDTFAAARSLSAIDQTYSGLNIDTTGDDDYYSVIPTDSGTMTVSLTFLHSQGDIDLEILNSAQTRLAFSDSASDGERRSLSVTAGQAVYIRAFGYRGATNPNYSLEIDVPNVSNVPIVRYVSMTAGGTLNSTDGTPSQGFSDADILKLTVQANGQYGYRLHFDASDVGLSTAGEDIDAFTFLPDGSIIASTVSSFSVPGPNGTTIAGNGEDLLRFVPTSLGSTTAGTWSMYFDGSDVRLSGTEENIDAVAVLADVNSGFDDRGLYRDHRVGQDEDDRLRTPSLGPTTVGAGLSISTAATSVSTRIAMRILTVSTCARTAAIRRFFSRRSVTSRQAA